MQYSLPLLALLVCLSTGCRTIDPVTTGQPADPFPAQLDSLMLAHHLPGLSVAVSRHGVPVFSRGYGYADLDSSRPVTTATPFRIASLTKPMAATVLLQLRNEGALDLDDRLKSFLPGYEQFYGRVRSYIKEELPDLAPLVENYDFTRDDITIRHHLTHTAEGEPGTAFKYNGFVYGTLSRVMEVRSGTDFANLLQARLFTPLGMTRSLPSQSGPDPDSLLADLALPYRFDEGNFARSPFPDTGVNAGAGIVTTAADLLRFDAAYARGDLLPEESVREMTTPFRLNDGSTSPYGLGWFIEELDGERVIWHYGWQPGAYSGLYIKVPRHGLTIVALANGEGLSSPFFQRDKRLAQNAFARLLLNRFIEGD